MRIHHKEANLRAGRKSTGRDSLALLVVPLGLGALVAVVGRYGYRRVTALLNQSGIEVGKDRVQRIWRREGLKVPQKQPKRFALADRRLMHSAAS